MLWLGTFAFDATPPLGHSCCGGFGGADCLPISRVDDALEAIGVVLIAPDELPVVLMALDWTGLANSAYARMCAALAEGAGTTTDRVTVHVLHPHNAPMACADTTALLLKHSHIPVQPEERPLDPEFYASLLLIARQAAASAAASATAVAYIGCGRAKVNQVASNRRVDLDPLTQTVRQMRGSSCGDPELRALTEGTVDPWLRTVTFFGGHDGAQKLASLHYYACHPMSYYGDGVATADFCGLARKQRQQNESGAAGGCRHLFFNGCGGNIGAGKYNDGSATMRPVLQSRVYDAIVESEQSQTKCTAGSIVWRKCPLDLRQPTAAVTAAESVLLRTISDDGQVTTMRERYYAAYELAWLRRDATQVRMTL